MAFQSTYTVSAGYFVILNATEYEFDVNVYSPVGTVVFEAILIAENPGDLSILVRFAGSISEFGPYSINGESTTFSTILFGNPQMTTTLIITLDTELDPNDGQVAYEFAINYVAQGIVSGMPVNKDAEVNVVLHEIGKLI